MAASGEFAPLGPGRTLARANARWWRPLRDVATWVAQYREFLGQSFDRLDEYLRDLQTNQKPVSPDQGNPKPEGQ